MGARVDLDPACADAKAMQRRQKGERSLLMSDRAGPSRLRDIVLRKQENETIDHKVGCPRCGPYRPPCASCQRPPGQGHKFFCPDNPHRWRNLFRRGPVPDDAPAPVPARRVPVEAAPRASRTVEAVSPVATAPGRPLSDARSRPGAAPRSKPAPAPTPAPAPAPRSAPPQPAAPPRAPPGPAAAAPSPPAAAKSAPRAPERAQGPPRAEAPPRAETPPPPPAKPAAPAGLEDAFLSLGLEPSAAWADVKSAFRQKALQYHPDKFATLAPEFREVAEKRMREINAAYDKLRAKLEA